MLRFLSDKPAGFRLWVELWEHEVDERQGNSSGCTYIILDIKKVSARL